MELYSFFPGCECDGIAEMERLEFAFKCNRKIASVWTRTFNNWRKTKGGNDTYYLHRSVDTIYKSTTDIYVYSLFSKRTTLEVPIGTRTLLWQTPLGWAPSPAAYYDRWLLILSFRVFRHLKNCIVCICYNSNTCMNIYDFWDILYPPTPPPP